MNKLKQWRLRNSIQSADYDERAYYSRIPFQRYWQRRRYKIIMNFVERKGKILDIGCGSSKIITDTPKAIGLDIRLNKLLYIKKTNKRLLNADGCSLPFKEGSIDCIICSEVIEHIANKRIFKELSRVLREDGILVIGTPDYASFIWIIIEFLYKLFHPDGYADEHVTRYSYQMLKRILLNNKFRILSHRYICFSELKIKARKKK